MDYIDHQVAEGIKAVKYIVGDLEADGHTHTFYLRDDLPRATDTSFMGPGQTWPHAHSIEKGPGNTLVCSSVSLKGNVHFHSIFTEVPS